jgi:ketosteroid isomerase-like protein
MSDHRHKILKRVALASLLFSPVCFAQSGAIEPGARKEIDAGNQAWVDGIKAGEAAPVAATYTENAVDCGPVGDCIQGRAAIEQHMKDQFAKLGRAQSAYVTSIGSVQQGNFVYEWGQAQANFANGKKVVERYLTAWQRQRDGSWKIFRNLVIPRDDAR